MAHGKMHYKLTALGSAVCGSYMPPNRTTDVSLVTCGLCAKNATFRLRGGTAPVATPRPPRPPRPVAAITVTPEVTEALRVLGRLANTWATRRNLCGQWDQAVEYLNTQLPEGAKLPSRFKTYVFRLTKGDEFISLEARAVSRDVAQTSLENQIPYDLRSSTRLVFHEEKES